MSELHPTSSSMLEFFSCISPAYSLEEQLERLAEIGLLEVSAADVPRIKNEVFSATHGMADVKSLMISQSDLPGVAFLLDVVRWLCQGHHKISKAIVGPEVLLCAANMVQRVNSPGQPAHRMVAFLRTLCEMQQSKVEEVLLSASPISCDGVVLETSVYIFTALSDHLVKAEQAKTVSDLQSPCEVMLLVNWLVAHARSENQLRLHQLCLAHIVPSVKVLLLVEDVANGWFVGSPIVMDGIERQTVWKLAKKVYPEATASKIEEIISSTTSRSLVGQLLQFIYCLTIHGVVGIMDFALPRWPTPMLAKLWHDSRLTEVDRGKLEMILNLHSSALNDVDLKDLQAIGRKLDKIPSAFSKKVQQACQFKDVKCGLPSCQKMETASRRFQKCSGCKAEAYCSRQCQKLHWEMHKLVCSSTIQSSAQQTHLRSKRTTSHT